MIAIDGQKDYCVQGHCLHKSRQWNRCCHCHTSVIPLECTDCVCVCECQGVCVRQGKDNEQDREMGK